jgi:hypothetical protein
MFSSETAGRKPKATIPRLVRDALKSFFTRKLRKARADAAFALFEAQWRNDARDIGKYQRALNAATSQLLKAERRWE